MANFSGIDGFPISMAMEDALRALRPRTLRFANSSCFELISYEIRTLYRSQWK